MSVDTQTVENKLRALYSLQLIDTRIEDIKTLRGELPMEVQDLEDEIAGLETRLRKYEGELNEAESEIASRKAFIKDASARSNKYQKQLYDIKNNREYDSLNKEIELLNLESQITEKKLEELMELVTVKKEELVAVNEALAQRNKDLAAKNAELDTIISETERDEQILMKASKAREADIDQRLLVAYKRLRDNSHNHLGVVPITRNACGGCFNKIPPQRQLDIRQRKKIIVCEHCGRILVDADIAQEAEEHAMSAAK